MSTKSSTESSSQATSQSLSKSVRIVFDGDELKIIVNSEELVFSATSGRGGQFSPIPEGHYWIRPRDFSRSAWMRPFAPVRLFGVQSGQWNEKRHTVPKSWEKLRISLYPNEVSNPHIPKTFFIGENQESYKSCISLSRFWEFVTLLKLAVKKHGLQEIPLEVCYTHTSDTAPAASTPPVTQKTEEAKSALKLENLKGHVPEPVIEQIRESAELFEITSHLRLAHFLAQCAHESAKFKLTTENLNYSEKGLKKIFPKYFLRQKKSAKDYARNPQKIGALVYASRMGNGNEASGEGYKYRGRGYIQLTGKSNYREFSKFIKDKRILDKPELVETHYPLASAAFFFKSKNLWSICDRGDTEQVVTALTKRVNGGTIGLADRLEHFKFYYKLLQKT